MSVFIGRMMVFFYVISVPLFLGLYVTSMVSAYPRSDALWFDGGLTEFGPAAFYVLLAIFVFPLCVSFCHYLRSDAESYLRKVLIISVWMSPWPIGSAMVAKVLRAEFPMAIVMIEKTLIFPAIVCVIGAAYSIYSMHKALSLQEDALSLQEEKRREVEGLSRRYGVSNVDVFEITDRLSVKIKAWGQYKGKQTDDYYVMLHLRMFGCLRLSVDDYWSFVEKAIGAPNFFRDEALAELERHVNFCPEFGGMQRYFHWLQELRRFELCDKSFGYYFSGTYGHGEVSLHQCLNDYRFGEFTNVTEYLEFLKARLPLYTAAEREKYQAEADKMTHPVLHRMLELGGFYRARALQIAQRSFSREFPVARLVPMPAPPAVVEETPPVVVVMPPPDTSPSARPSSVMISRQGQIIFNDIKQQNLSTMVMQGQVLTTDHYWCTGMAGWSLVSAYSSTDAPRQVPKKRVNWADIFKDFFLSWLLYVLGGTLIAGLIGYGNGGMSGVGSAIGGFLGFIILVRPVTFVFRTLFRLATGKRGMELFR